MIDSGRWGERFGDSGGVRRPSQPIGRAGRVRVLTQGWMLCGVVGVVMACLITEGRGARSPGDVRLLHSPTTSIHSLRFSPVSLTLASCETGGRLTLWELPGESPWQEWGSPDRKIKCVAFSPDREQMAWGFWDGSIVLWNLRTQTPSRTLEQGEASISALEFSPDGKTLAAGDASGAVALWNVGAGQVLGVLETRSRLITALDFSSDSRWMTAAGLDESGGTLLAADASSGATRQQLSLPAKSLVRTLEFLPGDDQVLWLDVGHQRLGSWDLDQGTTELLLDERHRLSAAALSPDGTTLAVGTSEGDVQLRARTSLQVTHRLGKQPNPIQSVDFSHDGRFVAVGGVVAGLLVWEP